MHRTLQIYKDVYKLTKAIYRTFPKMARADRFSIGYQLFEDSLVLLSKIIDANNARGKERIDVLDEFIGKFGIAEAKVRLISDLKILDQKSLTPLYVLIDSISKQAKAWRRSTRI